MVTVRFTVLLAVCVLVPAVVSDSSIAENVEGDETTFPRSILKEDIGYLNYIMDEYRRPLISRLAADMNAPRNQDVYKLWKRNADIINTLLGVPRRLFLAGR